VKDRQLCTVMPGGEPFQSFDRFQRIFGHRALAPERHRLVLDEALMYVTSSANGAVEPDRVLPDST